MNKIDFEYECKGHDDLKKRYDRYCFECGKNICSLCFKKYHKTHEIKRFEDLDIGEDEFNEIKEKENKLKLAKEELSNKHDEIKAINNKIIQITSIITELDKKINEKFKEINSDFEFNEKIIEYYKDEKINYYILNKIKSLRFTMTMKI